MKTARLSNTVFVVVVFCMFATVVLGVLKMQCVTNRLFPVARYAILMFSHEFNFSDRIIKLS